MRSKKQKLLLTAIFLGTLVIVAIDNPNPEESAENAPNKTGDNTKRIGDLEKILERSEELSEKEEEKAKARLEKRTRKSDKQKMLNNLQDRIDRGEAEDPCSPHKDFVTVGDDGRLGNQLSGYASMVGLAACTKMKAVISAVRLSFT